MVSIIFSLVGMQAGIIPRMGHGLAPIHAENADGFLTKLKKMAMRSTTIIPELSTINQTMA
jgi:hypothetical protein